MSYDDRLKIFKEFTLGLATLSKCTERHVAAIITDSKLTQVYSIGVNGGPKHSTNCLCITDGKYGCIHAEINALIKCTNTDKNKVMFVTLQPCKQCAAAIINAPGGFKAVYYMEEWKDDAGIQLLTKAGIHVARI